MGDETLKLLVERASCRNFADKAVPPQVLREALLAGVHAATGGNLQPCSVIQIQKQESRQRLAELCAQNFMARAPVHLLFCIDFYRLRRWAELNVAPFSATRAFRHFWIAFQDTIICAQSICTAADALGLGSVYIGTVLECFVELRDMFQLPDGVFPVVLLCLGYPKRRPHPRPKLGVDIVVHAERYHERDDATLRAAMAEKYRGRQWEPTPERRATLEEVCTQVHGPAFAQKCLARVEADGAVNVAQYYFGLHYRADQMPQGNDEYLALMEQFGFDWFKPYQPWADGEED
jgi:FMN reductase [NAD(P)H]